MEGPSADESRKRLLALELEERYPLCSPTQIYAVLERAGYHPAQAEQQLRQLSDATFHTWSPLPTATQQPASHGSFSQLGSSQGGLFEPLSVTTNRQPGNASLALGLQPETAMHITGARPDGGFPPQQLSAPPADEALYLSELPWAAAKAPAANPAWMDLPHLQHLLSSEQQHPAADQHYVLPWLQPSDTSEGLDQDQSSASSQPAGMFSAGAAVQSSPVTGARQASYGSPSTSPVGGALLKSTTVSAEASPSQSRKWWPLSGHCFGQVRQPGPAGVPADRPSPASIATGSTPAAPGQDPAQQPAPAKKPGKQQPWWAGMEPSQLAHTLQLLEAKGYGSAAASAPEAPAGVPWWQAATADDVARVLNGADAAAAGRSSAAAAATPPRMPRAQPRGVDPIHGSNSGRSSPRFAAAQQSSDERSSSAPPARISASDRERHPATPRLAATPQPQPKSHFLLAKMPKPVGSNLAAAASSNRPPHPVWAGLFLEPRSRAELMVVAQPRFPHLAAEAVLLLSRPRWEAAAEMQLGRRVELSALGVAQDRECQVVAVEMANWLSDYLPKGTAPHIVISHAQASQPRRPDKLASRAVADAHSGFSFEFTANYSFCFDPPAWPLQHLEAFVGVKMSDGSVLQSRQEAQTAQKALEDWEGLPLLRAHEAAVAEAAGLTPGKGNPTDNDKAKPPPLTDTVSKQVAQNAKRSEDGQPLRVPLRTQDTESETHCSKLLKTAAEPNTSDPAGAAEPLSAVLEGGGSTDGSKDGLTGPVLGPHPQQQAGSVGSSSEGAVVGRGSPVEAGSAESSPKAAGEVVGQNKQLAPEGVSKSMAGLGSARICAVAGPADGAGKECETGSKGSLTAADSEARPLGAGGDAGSCRAEPVAAANHAEVESAGGHKNLPADEDDWMAIQQLDDLLDGGSSKLGLKAPAPLPHAATSTGGTTRRGRSAGKKKSGAGIAKALLSNSTAGQAAVPAVIGAMRGGDVSTSTAGKAAVPAVIATGRSGDGLVEKGPAVKGPHEKVPGAAAEKAPRGVAGAAERATAALARQAAARAAAGGAKETMAGSEDPYARPPPSRPLYDPNASSSRSRQEAQSAAVKGPSAPTIRLLTRAGVVEPRGEQAAAELQQSPASKQSAQAVKAKDKPRERAPAAKPQQVAKPAAIPLGPSLLSSLGFLKPAAVPKQAPQAERAAVPKQASQAKLEEPGEGAAEAQQLPIATAPSHVEATSRSATQLSEQLRQPQQPPAPAAAACEPSSTPLTASPIEAPPKEAEAPSAPQPEAPPPAASTPAPTQPSITDLLALFAKKPKQPAATPQPSISAAPQPTPVLGPAPAAKRTPADATPLGKKGQLKQEGQKKKKSQGQGRAAPALTGEGGRGWWESGPQEAPAKAPPSTKPLARIGRLAAETAAVPPPSAVEQESAAPPLAAPRAAVGLPPGGGVLAEEDLLLSQLLPVPQPVPGPPTPFKARSDEGRPAEGSGPALRRRDGTLVGGGGGFASLDGTSGLAPFGGMKQPSSTLAATDIADDAISLTTWPASAATQKPGGAAAGTDGSRFVSMLLPGIATNPGGTPATAATGGGVAGSGGVEGGQEGALAQEQWSDEEEGGIALDEREKLASLLEAFPELQESLALFVLRECKGDLSAAIADLSGDALRPPSPPPGPRPGSAATTATPTSPTADDSAFYDESAWPSLGATPTPRSGPNSRAGTPGRMRDRAVTPGRDRALTPGRRRGSALNGGGGGAEGDAMKRVADGEWRTAHMHYRARQMFFQAAKGSEASGDYAGAKELYAKAHEHGELARAAREAASRAAFAGHNMGRVNRMKVDLHGINVDEALQVLETHLVNLAALGHPEGILLEVVTGVGKHSIQGKAKILPAVLQHLTDGNHRFSLAPENPGVVNVLIGGRQ